MILNLERSVLFSCMGILNFEKGFIARNLQNGSLHARVLTALFCGVTLSACSEADPLQGIRDFFSFPEFSTSPPPEEEKDLATDREEAPAPGPVEEQISPLEIELLLPQGVFSAGTEKRLKDLDDQVDLTIAHYPWDPFLDHAAERPSGFRHPQKIRLALRLESGEIAGPAALEVKPYLLSALGLAYHPEDFDPPPESWQAFFPFPLASGLLRSQEDEAAAAAGLSEGYGWYPGEQEMLSVALLSIPANPATSHAEHLDMAMTLLQAAQEDRAGASRSPTGERFVRKEIPLTVLYSHQWFALRKEAEKAEEQSAGAFTVPREGTMALRLSWHLEAAPGLDPDITREAVAPILAKLQSPDVLEEARDSTGFAPFPRSAQADAASDSPGDETLASLPVFRSYQPRPARDGFQLERQEPYLRQTLRLLLDRDPLSVAGDQILFTDISSRASTYAQRQLGIHASVPTNQLGESTGQAAPASEDLIDVVRRLESDSNEIDADDIAEH